MIEDVQQAKEELIKAGKQLMQSGMLYRGEHANLTARVGKERMVMTKGGSISNLNMDSFAVLDLQGNIIEGEMTSVNQEVIDMHSAIYQEKTEVGSIIHVHAPNVTVFAIAHQELPVAYEPLVRYGITEPIPVVDWAPRGSEESVNGILKIVRNHPNLPALMMANHGVLGYSSDPMTTALLLATLDEAAELTLKARQIGGEKLLPEEAFTKVKARMEQFQSK